MTVDEAIEHGRAWVEAGWTWKPGQVYIAVSIHGYPTSRGLVYFRDSCVEESGSPVNDQWEAVPDLRDPGTLGHAEAQVCEAWGSEFVFAHPPNRLDPWDVLCPDDGAWSRIGRGDTKHEALLAARRAAP